MPILSTDEIDALGPDLAPIEGEEPIAAAWRLHAGIPTIRRRGDAAKAVLRNARALCGARFRAVRPAPGQVVVIVKSSTPATSGALRPILQELKRRGHPAFLLTSPAASTLVKEGLHRGQFDLRFLPGLLTARQRQLATDFGVSIADRLTAVLGPERDGDARIWMVAGTLARAAATEWVSGAGAVISDNDIDSVRKGIFLGASHAGVASAVLQHGLVDNQFFPLAAGAFLCWGPHFFRQAIGYGIQESRLAVCGCPRFDEFAPGVDDRYRSRVTGGREGRAARPVEVLAISTAHIADSYPARYEAYFGSLRALLAGDFHVTVRLHPSEPGIQSYERNLSRALYSRMTVSPPAQSLSDALSRAEIVYHVNSTACIEALLQGVPVLSERGGGIAQSYDLPDIGVGAWVTPARVAERARSLARDPSERADTLDRQRKAIPSLLAHLGSATRFTVDHILEMAGTR